MELRNEAYRIRNQLEKDLELDVYENRRPAAIKINGYLINIRSSSNGFNLTKGPIGEQVYDYYILTPKSKENPDEEIQKKFYWIVKVYEDAFVDAKVDSGGCSRLNSRSKTITLGRATLEGKEFTKYNYEKLKEMLLNLCR